MPLKRSTLAKAVKTAFSALGDIPESATLIRSTSKYNTSTGTNVVSTTKFSIKKAIFTSFQISEVDDVVVKASDVKMLIQQTDISTRPNISTDDIERNSKSYSILDLKEDPAGVLYILQLRAV